MIGFDKNKSLEQIENDYWKEIDYPTGLVQKCHELRKKKLRSLEVSELRILISQNIGLEFLVPISIDFLNNNLLAEGDFYPGDLLESLVSRDCNFWLNNKKYWSELKTAIEVGSNDIEKSDLISKEIKEDIFKKIKKFISCIE